MKYSTTARGRYADFCIIAVECLLYGLISFCASSALLVAQDSTEKATEPTSQSTASPQTTTQQATAPESESVKAWRKAMARKPLPKKGCFHADYPSTEWKEVPCTKALPRPYPPQGKAGKGSQPFTVGGPSGDWLGHVSGLISTAVGSFNSITGLTNATSNTFSLQLNANTFSTTACNGVAGCQGWQQFIFTQTGCTGNTPCVIMQYWLIGFGPTCPAGWLQTPLAPNDCFQDSAATAVPLQPITNLANLSLMGEATGGTDTVILTPGTGLDAVGQDSVLNLEQGWTTAEFNVFGDGNAGQLAFNSGTTIVVKTSIDYGNGSTNQPSCVDHSFTGETNNLTLADVTNTSTLICCAYGGASPNIQFMETNASPPHTGVCGATQLLGDPHITTPSGIRYDFQSAGEFVSLRDSDGAEVQTRQTPVSTTFIGTDSYDNLTTCVSLNTAVAARVGEHRVTYEPNLSGVPDPSGLQLRIDGALTMLGAAGRDLGNGGRVFESSPSGELEVDLPDGKTLFVTPQWWASQSKWYLNVNVVNLGLLSGDAGDSTRGIAATIANDSWLPALPNGASLGPMPGSLHDRYVTLYRKFADAWRLTNKDSLFDYAPGTSTETFTMRDWPPEKPPCVVPNTKPVEPASEALAEAACRRVFDHNMHSDCVFDVRVTGNIDFATTYLTTQRVLADSTTISLTDDADPSQVGEWVTFTAYVAANSSAVAGFPSGTVQFAVDGSSVGEPVTVDAKGRANWSTSQIKVGTHRITASYLPGADSVFLPSTSIEKTHVVRRCPCEEARQY